MSQILINKSRLTNLSQSTGTLKGFVNLRLSVTFASHRSQDHCSESSRLVHSTYGHSLPHVRKMESISSSYPRELPTRSGYSTGMLPGSEYNVKREHSRQRYILRRVERGNLSHWSTVIRMGITEDPIALPFSVQSLIQSGGVVLGTPSLHGCVCARPCLILPLSSSSLTHTASAPGHRQNRWLPR